MPLPPQVNATICARFESLIAEAKILLAIYEGEDAREHAYYQQPAMDPYAQHFPSEPLPPPPGMSGTLTAFVSLRTRVVSVVEMLSSRAGDHPARIVLQLGTFPATTHGMQQIIGVLTGIFDDYKSGILEKVTAMIEAEVTADYLGQAESLLADNHTGLADRVPAAVLTGAVLENALRKLCQRQLPPIDLLNASGKHKMMAVIIDELKAAGLYNELQAKDLRAWADIRNAAAHGRFTDFDRGQVERMLTGVSAFLIKHM